MEIPLIVDTLEKPQVAETRGAKFKRSLYPITGSVLTAFILSGCSCMDSVQCAMYKFDAFIYNILGKMETVRFLTDVMMPRVCK